jgi:hypothetical protein
MNPLAPLFVYVSFRAYWHFQDNFPQIVRENNKIRSMPETTQAQRDAKHLEVVRVRNLRATGRNDGKWRSCK